MHKHTNRRQIYNTHNKQTIQIIYIDVEILIENTHRNEHNAQNHRQKHRYRFTPKPLQIHTMYINVDD